MFNRQRNFRVATQNGQVMLRQNLIEDALDADCAECRNLRESYVEGCFLLEEVEALPASEGELQKVRDRVSFLRRAWLAAVRKTMKRPNQTRSDLKAKAPIIKGLLQDLCGDNLETMSITLTFFDDVERILSERA